MSWGARGEAVAWQTFVSTFLDSDPGGGSYLFANESIASISSAHQRHLSANLSSSVSSGKHFPVFKPTTSELISLSLSASVWEQILNRCRSLVNNTRRLRRSHTLTLGPRNSKEKDKFTIRVTRLRRHDDVIFWKGVLKYFCLDVNK